MTVTAAPALVALAAVPPLASAAQGGEGTALAFALALAAGAVGPVGAVGDVGAASSLAWALTRCSGWTWVG